MHIPSIFDSFMMGGFECSTHRRNDQRRLDLIAATGHDRWVAQDYVNMASVGLGCVRDGLRWHLIEQRPGRYDWSSFLPMLRAANAQSVQVIWDLCHYGLPDDIDIWRPAFVERFARYAGAVARLVRAESPAVPFYSPINEISFWAWAGGDVAYFNPTTTGRTMELKHQLVRASIAAIEEIRAVDNRARFVQADPAIHVIAPNKRADQIENAERYRLAQYEAWDLLAGMQWPGLGGRPEFLDIIGVNYYPHNQWFHGGERILLGDPHYRPFAGMLSEIYQRYRRPILLSETGAEGSLRVPWLAYVSEQVMQAMAQNVPIEGICLYPVLDYPGWDDDRHCSAGLFGFADFMGCRTAHEPLLHEVQKLTARFGSASPLAYPVTVRARHER